MTMRPLASAFAALLLAAAAWPAAAQTSGRQPVLVSIKRMSLDTALKAARAALEACRKEGVQVAVTVIDRGGHAQAVLRDVLAPDLTLAVSRGKAYAAMSFVTPTSQLEARFARPYGPPSLNGAVIAAGGLPIRAGGELVGAIGVSGAPSGQVDERCAAAGYEAISEDLELGG
ncbi:MAG TPA: heme-binding protein [Burkholderiales bacterium]